MTRLFDPARHEPLQPIAWSEAAARAAIQRIVADTEARYAPDRYWPLHPRDLEPGDDPQQRATRLYDGACGVIWALHHLQGVGAARLSRSYLGVLEPLLQHNRACLQSAGSEDFASYLMGDTPILLLAQGARPTPARADALAALIAGNIDHPARELMWGAPGTLLAALFLHQRTGQARWAALFRQTAARLWSQLEWSAEHACAHWTQDLYGRRSTYLDAVHGFVATASPLIRGRALLDPADWAAWQACIVNTVQRTATWDGARASWRAWLELTPGQAPRMLMQFCHGAPGFVVCLADLPGPELDALLVAAGEATWAAGPLKKGSNLCHGTGGNGYAFLKLYRRTGDPRWLARARAFAMHGIAQTEAEAAQHGRLRYSLWTGDPGFAVYLWDCLRGEAAFPTLDVFYTA
ncbi:MAG: LanC-like protein [Burkholderiales bacterium]|nr:LanC-like protein [Burkholderiales bacterium]